MEVESDVESSVTEEPLRIENPLAATVDKSEISPTLQDAYKFLYGGAKNSTEAKTKQPCPELPSNLSECLFLLSILLAILRSWYMLLRNLLQKAAHVLLFI